MGKEPDFSELKAYREENRVIVILPTEEDAKKLCKMMYRMKDIADTLLCLS